MGLKHVLSIVSVVLLLAPSALALAAPWPAPLPSFRLKGEQALPTELMPSEPETAISEPAEIGAGPSTRTVTATSVTSGTIAEPQPVTLTALATEGSAPIAGGLNWRIYDTRTDSEGKLARLDESDDAVAHFSLPPGNYVVHVAYGRAQVTDTLTVAEGNNTKSVVLEAGGLRLNAAVTGDVPIPINLLRFDIFTAGASELDRIPVAQGLGANDIVALSAGTYHVVSYFGSINAVVRADLRVEPGQLTDVVLYHKAAQMSFRLVSEAGGEAIADVDWTVKSADGSTVFTDIGAFPATVLQEGDYVILAKRGEQVFNREFQVQPGQPREIEVLTAVY